MVFGVVSLILWALIIVVTIKYVPFILRADNNGEGGTLTLMAFAQRAMGDDVFVIVLLGMAGAALFYGDAIITPAISVLSAVEGLTLVTPAFERYVLPLSLVILISLFAVQSHGTARVAAWFGLDHGVWFALMALGGIRAIVDGSEHSGRDQPDLRSIVSCPSWDVRSPRLGGRVPGRHGRGGAVRRSGALRPPPDPDRLARIGAAIARPELRRAGRLLLADPSKLENLFFRYPDWALLPMVGMATRDHYREPP